MGGHLHAKGKHGQWRRNLTINAVLSKTSFSIKLRELFRRFSELCAGTETDAGFSGAHDKQEESNVPAE